MKSALTCTLAALAAAPASLGAGPSIEAAARRAVFAGELDSTLAPVTLDDPGPGAPPVALAADDEAPPSEWKSHFDLSLAGSFGNTDDQSLHVGIDSLREDERTRTSLDAHYFLGMSDGDRTQNKLTTGILQDWLFPDSRWLWFADARYDYDEFQSWEHRVSAHTGPGYQLIDSEDVDLILRGGVGFNKEWNSEDEPFTWEGFLGFEWGWQISDRQRIGATGTWFPQLEDPSEFRTVSTVDWSLLVDEESAMSISAGLRHEHQTEVDPGVEHNDWNVYAGLRFDF